MRFYLNESNIDQILRFKMNYRPQDYKKSVKHNGHTYIKIYSFCHDEKGIKKFFLMGGCFLAAVLSFGFALLSDDVLVGIGGMRYKNVYILKDDDSISKFQKRMQTVWDKKFVDRAYEIYLKDLIKKAFSDIYHNDELAKLYSYKKEKTAIDGRNNLIKSPLEYSLSRYAQLKELENDFPYDSKFIRPENFDDKLLPSKVYHRQTKIQAAKTKLESAGFSEQEYKVLVKKILVGDAFNLRTELSNDEKIRSMQDLYKTIKELAFGFTSGDFAYKSFFKFSKDHGTSETELIYRIAFNEEKQEIAADFNKT